MMDWKKLFLPPVLIYVAIFMLVSALIGFKIDQTAMWVWIVELVITIYGLSVSANYVKAKSMKAVLSFSLVWLVVLVILDLLLTVPFTGVEYFYNWKSYLPYLLTILVPVLVFRNKSR